MPKFAPSTSLAIGSVRFCGARGDTVWADTVDHPVLSDGIITFRYCFYRREIGVDQTQSMIHNWIQKAELQPTNGIQPDHVSIDETVIHLNDQRYWLDAAINPETGKYECTALFDTNHSVYYEVSERTYREIRCRRRRVSH